MNATGTLVDGVVQFDQPVDWPNHSRVNVQFDPQDVAPAVRSATAFEEFKKLVEEHPIDSGGLRFTREELHERR